MDLDRREGEELGGVEGIETIIRIIMRKKYSFNLKSQFGECGSEIRYKRGRMEISSRQGGHL